MVLPVVRTSDLVLASYLNSTNLNHIVGSISVAEGEIRRSSILTRAASVNFSIVFSHALVKARVAIALAVIGSKLSYLIWRHLH
ncbi:MAG: hypothetical protein RMZ42_07265 [Nostoc sp. DedQUE05]|uniref:hypothetical protein n=1 Tax=Nostoc sp. DedQUE05 TaxID=3075391 RepID=UPI002AD2BAE0|nr:hypothetical protein [Nostoc sp. DedQUE05]MDZ8091726.1 hypothetical protein [Nostoc sp. DedQUE05]